MVIWFKMLGIMTANNNDATRAEPTALSNLDALAKSIVEWGLDLGFDAVGISDTELSQHETHLNNWISNGFHGQMDYMYKHGSKRTRPSELVEGTIRVISVRIDYAPDDIDQAEKALETPQIGYVSRYALGRDYHKVVRKKLQDLATRIQSHIGDFGYRVFTDSAPVMEKAIAEKAGLGWIGKHSNLIDSKTGSWFFLGEIYTDLPLPVSSPSTNHCGTCSQCIDACPTGAIVGPYQVDARLCISYLTIELKDSIPEDLRPLVGNRIYGCDDCQLVCPWNKFAQTSSETDFSPRATLQDRDLAELLSWSEKTFLKNTEGTAIRRIGHESWQRNISVAIGNALRNRNTSEADKAELTKALNQAKAHASAMVNEHIDWALQQLS